VGIFFWGTEFACKLAGFVEDEHLKGAFEKAPQNFYADEFLVHCGSQGPLPLFTRAVEFDCYLFNILS